MGPLLHQECPEQRGVHSWDCGKNRQGQDNGQPRVVQAQDIIFYGWRWNDGAASIGVAGQCHYDCLPEYFLHLTWSLAVFYAPFSKYSSQLYPFGFPSEFEFLSFASVIAFGRCLIFSGFGWEIGLFRTRVLSFQMAGRCNSSLVKSWNKSFILNLLTFSAEKNLQDLVFKVRTEQMSHLRCLELFLCHFNIKPLFTAS